MWQTTPRLAANVRQSIAISTDHANVTHHMGHTNVSSEYHLTGSAHANLGRFLSAKLIDSKRKLIMLNSTRGDQSLRHMYAAPHIVSSQRSADCSTAPHRISSRLSDRRLRLLDSELDVHMHTILRVLVHRSSASTNAIFIKLMRVCETCQAMRLNASARVLTRYLNCSSPPHVQLVSC